LLDDHRELEPPDPIPNSEVKRFLADGSVGFPHVRVGHRQAFILKPLISNDRGFFMCERKITPCCGQVFSYIMTGAFMLLQPQRDLNIDCNYALYDNCNVEYIS
jgi:hypothetical protein